jgi:hypothetical protein
MFISISPNLIVDILANVGIAILLLIPITWFLIWFFSSNNKKAKKRANEWIESNQMPSDEKNFWRVVDILKSVEKDSEAEYLYKKLLELKNSKAA